MAEGPGPAGFRIKGRLWLEKDGETYLSRGRLVLLERIRELGSIAAAARSPDMAYSHAWTLVAEMNRLAGQELVSRTFEFFMVGLASDLAKIAAAINALDAYRRIAKAH